MPATKSLIQKITLNVDSPSITFSSIPNTYTDLIIVESSRSAVNAVVDGLDIWFNADTNSANYKRNRLLGNGTAASNDTQKLILIPGATATANTFGNSEIYIPNYAGSTNKSFSTTTCQETNATTAYIAAGAGEWSNTAAITSIQLVSQNLSNFKSESTFYLYGIKAGPDTPILTQSTATTSSTQVIISNYSASLTYSISASVGSVSRTGNTITVTGLTEGQTTTITASATDSNNISSLQGSLASAAAPQTPTITLATALTTSLTFTITNYNAAYSYTVSSSGGSASVSTNTITVTGLSPATSYTAYATATINGVNSAQGSGSGSTVALPSGGTITTLSNVRFHTFTATGTFTATTPLTTEVLVVAGGGGGGATGPGAAGGGGAGGMVTQSSYVIPANSYTITVGGGGQKGTSRGTDSSIVSPGLSLTASGGGVGSSAAAPTQPLLPGGSGGGGVGMSSPGGAGTSGQGNSGGGGGVSPSPAFVPLGGGGGGRGSAGGSAPIVAAGSGGSGQLWPINSVTYAGGGGGSTSNPSIYTSGSGGPGGGGNGFGSPLGYSSGGTNTGGGGGGGANPTTNGNGGSGIVIIRYPI